MSTVSTDLEQSYFKPAFQQASTDDSQKFSPQTTNGALAPEMDTNILIDDNINNIVILPKSQQIIPKKPINSAGYFMAPYLPKRSS